MGVTNGHSLLYCIKNLTITDICAISQKRNTISLQKNNNRSSKPVIDVDASWLAHQTNKTSTPVQFVVSIGLLFVQAGFDVVLVCDGCTRHHSKRATIKRCFKKHSEKICLLLHRCNYTSLVGNSKTAITVVEKENHLKEIQNVKEKINSLDNKINSAQVDIGLMFHEALFISINELTENDIGSKNGSMRMLIAEFQADSVIAHRTINHDNDITLCADSDQVVLCGSKCISIKRFKYINSRKSKCISNIEIFTSQYKTIIDIANTLNLPLTSPTIYAPKYPLFEKEFNTEVRALMGVGIGCDVFLSGVPNVGPNKIYELLKLHDGIEINNQQIYDHLIELYITSYKKKKEKDTKQKCENEDIEKYKQMINVFVESYIYEPSNYVQSPFELYNNNDKNLFMTDNVPNSLHPYNMEYRRGYQCINIFPPVDCCVDVDWCVGVGTGEHLFMKHEGFANCCVCQNNCCAICKHTNNNQTYCAQCYLPSYCKLHDFEQPIENLLQKSKEEMTEYLATVGITVLQSDSIREIREIFETVYDKKENVLYDTSICDAITMPEQETNYLQSILPISNFRFFDGGHFIFKNDHTTEDMIQLMELMNELVDIKNCDINNNQSFQTYHSILPKLIINFAKESRFHSGERLLKRTVRHATDERTNKILEANGQIFRYNDKIGLKIYHKVKASMKADVYDVVVAFTSNSIVACSCNCQVGAIRNMKLICVHIFPVIYQITLLLFQCLSEHMLVELASYTKNENNIDLENETYYTKFHEFIMKQRIACQHSQPSDKEKKIADLLHEYEVGTQKMKKYIINAGDYNKLTHCFIRNLKFETPATQAKKIVRGNEANDESKEDEQINTNEAIEVDNNNFVSKDTYIQICKSIHAVSKNLKYSKCSFLRDILGYRLLSYRAGWNFNLSYRCASETRDWKQLLDKADSFKRVDRAYKQNPKKTQDTVAASEDCYVCVDDDMLSCNSTSSHHESINNQRLVEILHVNNHAPKQTKPIHRFSCCAKDCRRTTRTHPNAKFRKVPKSSINDSKNAKSPFTYFKKRLHRKIFLKRLGIKDYAINQKCLMYCDQHTLESKKIKIEWLDGSNNEKKKECFVVVPTKPIDLRSSIDSTTRITRQQNDERKPPPSPRRSSVRTKEKCEYAVEIRKPKIRKCCHPKCTSTCDVPGIAFTKLPSIPSIKKVVNEKRDFYRRQHAFNIMLRQETLRSMSIDMVNDKRVDLRICNQHRLEKVEKTVRWINNKGKEETTQTTMYLPAAQKSIGSVSLTDTGRASGLGLDRSVQNHLRIANEIVRNDTFSQEQQRALQFILQEAIEKNSPTEEEEAKQNERIRLVALENNNTANKYNNNTKFQISNIDDKEIKRRTGFSSLTHLISYILILCKGDFGIVATTISRLTWLEEWLLFFESFWAKSSDRWEDVSSTYGTCIYTCRTVFQYKLKFVLQTRQDWPAFVTLQEDEALRNEKYTKEPFKGKRLIMWDATDVRLMKPTAAELQRLTYSSYYSGCVAKGGIGIQTSGWIATEELCTGGISDREYMAKTNIYLKQQQYIPLHDPNTSTTPWMNVLDRGFVGAAAEAFSYGGQLALQPQYANCQRHFTSLEVLLSAAVAADRGANERAVRYLKACGFISKGLRKNESPNILADVWLSWGFQVNFVYNPVL